VENIADSCPFPKKAHSFGGVDERQCAVRSEYRRVGADHFPAAARIDVRHFGDIDHKSTYARLKLVQHMFAKAQKRAVVNHSAGDLDEIDVVSHFRGNLHAPTVFPDSIRVKILCVLFSLPTVHSHTGLIIAVGSEHCAACHQSASPAATPAYSFLSSDPYFYWRACCWDWIF